MKGYGQLIAICDDYSHEPMAALIYGVRTQAREHAKI